ncbi:MAG: TetR/AcrR family transcriptional regulator, partial [Steroidobacteraceae bacterium]
MASELHDSELATLCRPGLSRGRPAVRANRHVREDILLAAEECFATKNPTDISAKEIAAHAGTRSAMIYYYFGSKEGLLGEIIRRNVEEIQREFLTMQGAIDRNDLRNPTREMIAFLITVFHRHPTLCRILGCELVREESPLTQLYLRQWNSRARKMMTQAMSKLADRGYYRRDIDVERVFAMIRSVVFFPIASRLHMAQTGEPSQSYLDDAWIDFVSTVFDSYLRPR